MWEIPIPVSLRFKVWLRGSSLAGIAGSILAVDMDVCLFWVLCVMR